MNVAIYGQMGSGKTSLAQEFEQRYFFSRMSFATKLKDVVGDLWCLDKSLTDGVNKNRQLLQDVGRKLREVDKDVWVNYLLRELDARESLIKKYGSDNPYGDGVVVDDVRLRNEYDALKKKGFIMVKIIASEATRRKRLGKRFQNPNDISETDLMNENDWDVIIENDNDDINVLSQAVETIYESFYNKKRKSLNTVICL